MAKLPRKLVQPPVFDSPLRRTSTPTLTVLEETEKATAHLPDTEQTVRPNSLQSSQQASGDADELLHRVTVRLSQSQWEAIQTECFRLRMRGQKTNASALVRDIVERWMTLQG